VEHTDDLWTAVSQLLRAQVSDAVWYSTFNDVHSLPDDQNTLRLAVPSGTVRDKITSRYLPIVLDALTELGAGSLKLVVDVVAPDEIVADSSTNTDVTPRTNTKNPSKNGSKNSAPTVASVEEMGIRAGLNPRYTFETFVRGI